MKEVIKLLSIVNIFVISLMFFGHANLVLAKNTSENIKNNVSATANTGGNKIEGGGKIETGDASAKAEAEIYTDGKNTDMKATVKAEANGKTAEIATDEPGNLEAVADQNGTCVAKGDETCVDDSDSEQEKDTSVESAAEAMNSQKDNENFIQKIFSAVTEMKNDLTEKIGSWFS